MGVWGAGSFENDEAADWIADFCEDPDEGLLLNTFTTITEMEKDGYLEASDCSACIAAAEVVAALKGAPHPNISSELKECVANLEMRVDRKKIDYALKALAVIKMDSELKELWDESQDSADWYAAMGDLETRLKK